MSAPTPAPRADGLSHHDNDPVELIPAPPVAPRLALVEDELGFSQDLARLIETQPGWQCVATCATADEALTRLPALKPDLVLIDVLLDDHRGNPVPDGLALVPRLRALLPEARLVMLTVAHDTDYFLQALQGGAIGYIIRGGSETEFIEQLRTILEGGAYMSPAIARKLAHWFETHKPANAPAGFRLTEREWQILDLTARGRSQQEIADLLGTKRPTVRNQMQKIYSKFQVNSSAAVIYQVAPILRVRETLRTWRQSPPPKP